MKRMPWLTLILILMLTLTLATAAQAVEKNGGLAVAYVSPDGDLELVADDGYGLAAIFDYPMSHLIDITGSIGRYRFGGVEIADGVESDATSLWEFAAGPQLSTGAFYAGAEAGYYTELDEWGLVPNVGMRKDLLDISVRYKATGEGNFYAVRLGFFF